MLQQLAKVSTAMQTSLGPADRQCVLADSCIIFHTACSVHCISWLRGGSLPAGIGGILGSKKGLSGFLLNQCTGWQGAAAS